MDDVHGCSRCKKATSNRSESTSLHNTLAYTRCRCHRSFTKQHSIATVTTSTSIQVPTSSQTSKTSLYTTCGKSDSSSLHPNTKHLSSSTMDNHSPTTETFDSELTLPPIDKQRSLVVDVFESDDSGGCGCTNSASTTLAPTNNQKFQSQSTTAVLKASLQTVPPLSRKIDQKQRTSKVDIFQLSDMVHFIPQRKINELRLLFKHFDTDGDGHLSLVQFMGVIPCTHTKKSDLDFLKQLHVRLSNETYFGSKEFTLGYCIAESLSMWSSRLKQEYQVKENFIDVLTLFMTVLAKKSSVDGFVSITAVTEAAHTLHHNLRVLPSALAEIASGGQLHLLKCLSLAPYFLCIS